MSSSLSMLSFGKGCGALGIFAGRKGANALPSSLSVGHTSILLKSTKSLSCLGPSVRDSPGPSYCTCRTDKVASETVAMPVVNSLRPPAKDATRRCSRAIMLTTRCIRSLRRLTTKDRLSGSSRVISSSNVGGCAEAPPTQTSSDWLSSVTHDAKGSCLDAAFLKRVKYLCRLLEVV